MEWFAFYQLEPWGFEANCFASGIVAATVANVNRDPKRKAKPFEAIDFVPGAKTAPLDPRKLKAQMMTLAALAKAKQDGRSSDLQNHRGTKPRKKIEGFRANRRHKNRR